MGSPFNQSPHAESRHRSHRRQAIASLILAMLCPAAVAQKIPLAIGQQFQPPALTLLDGAPVDWPRLQGNLLILEFWASWCPFCARQNPLLDRFYREYKSRGLEVITISLDKTKDAAVGYMKKGGYAFKAAMANEAWTAIYRQRQGLPQVFVIDRRNQIVAIEVREMMEEDIRELARFL
jgi:thiol-disulfide isomerase/thioredoxin